MASIQRVQVVFSGRVQGVGFRYTAAGIARSSGISGWVTNLRDGSVEVCAEGETETLKAFIAELSGEFAGNIRGTQIDWQPATGEFNGFDVVF